MNLAPIDPGFDQSAQVPLQIIHLRKQVNEGGIGTAGGVAARDVAAVPATRGARIDQQRVMPRRTVTLQNLIVQYRACLVQRHDRVIGELLLPLPAGTDKGLVNVVLAAPADKAVRCGGMTA